MSPELQLIPYALISLLGAMSPGADFALITRIATLSGRRSGISAAVGVASGMAVNTTASILGLGAVLITSRWLYAALTILGGCYLAYLGVRALWSMRSPGPTESTEQTSPSRRSLWASYRRGLIVNILNPKVIVFLVALMPQFLPRHPTVADQLAVGSVTVLAPLVWFTMVAFTFGLLKQVFERPAVRRTFNTFTGVVLITLGLRIAIG